MRAGGARPARVRRGARAARDRGGPATGSTHGDLRTRLARHHRDPDAAFRNWNDVWLDPAFRSWDLRPELAAITCPVLAIQGTADPYGTVAHVEAVRDAAAGPVELLLLDGGHAPHLEHPDAVTAAVVAFLRTARSRAEPAVSDAVQPAQAVGVITSSGPAGRAAA